MGGHWNFRAVGGGGGGGGGVNGSQRTHKPKQEFPGGVGKERGIKPINLPR